MTTTIPSRATNKSNMDQLINDTNWTKFDKIYKYKKIASSKTNATIWKIANYNNLCFKEFKIKSDKQLKNIYNEYIALKTYYAAYHGYNKMVKLYINTNKPRKARLVQKYYVGEDLDDFLVDEEDGDVGFLFENDFRMIMKKILYELYILHNNNILHCDLKPHNIRINEQSDKFDEDDANYYDVNIIDLGYAQILNPKNNKNKRLKLDHIKGTPGFIAPEIIRNKTYSIKSDMFSIGCIAFFLITNQYAVLQSNDMNLEDMMPDRKRLKRLLKRENDRNRDNESKIHHKTIDFVLSCLWRNPSKRPTVEEALKNQIFH